MWTTLKDCEPTVCCIRFVFLNIQSLVLIQGGPALNVDCREGGSLIEFKQIRVFKISFFFFKNLNVWSRKHG